MTTTVSSVTGGERTERRSDAEGKKAPRVSFPPEASSGGDVLKNADDDDGSVVAESRVADSGDANAFPERKDSPPLSARGRDYTASAFTSGSASPASPYSGSSTPGGFAGYDSRVSAFYDSGSITPPALASGAATPSLRWNGLNGLDGLESMIGSARPSGFQASSSSMMVAHSRRAAGRANKAADLAEWSCFCVPPHHKWREFAYDVVKHEAFERVMFLLIGVSCVVMALERPGMEKSLERVLKRVDLALAVCFALEVSLKSFAFGLRRFLNERVNRLDLCIVLFAVLEICLTSAGGLGAIRSLRILRAIRPLRALTKSPGMRLVLKSVALSVGAMANVSAVLLLVFAVFGILGVQIFAGRFYRCDDPTVPNKAACVGTYVHPVTGITLQRTWSNAYLNFDSLPDALVSLFVASTLDGYGQLLFDGLDAVGVDEQPRRDANPGAFFFFLAFIVLCAFALLNLYVGVIFYQFSRIRTLSQTSSLDLTEAQKEWGEMCRTVLRMRRRKKMPLPANPLRRIPYRVASHEKFEDGVFLALVAAAAVTATRTRDELPYVADAREHAEVFFFVVFACEALLKSTAVGFKEYWREPWNRFDFACVAFSALDVVFRAAFLRSADGERSEFAFTYGHDEFEHLEHLGGHYDSGHTNDTTHYENASLRRYDYDAYVYRLAGPETARRTAERFLGLAKVARLVRLVKHLKGLRDLLETLVASLPAFWNVGALVALLFFIYAYVGVILFGTTPRTNTNEGGSLDEHANFESFPRAVLTLFRVATNDEWVGVMRDCAGDAVTGLAAYPFFVSFVVLVSMVMLNLFTAVIIENFENCQDHEHWKVSPNALRPFVDAFHKFDDGSGTVRGVDLERMLREIPPPLGLGGGNGSLRTRIGSTIKTKTHANDRPSGGGSGSMLVVHFIKSLNVPLDARGRAPFRRTAFELVRRVCECDMPPGEMRDALEHAVRRAFPDLWEPIPDEMSWAALMCVVRVQRHWRARAAARAAAAKKQAKALAEKKKAARDRARLSVAGAPMESPSRRVSRAAASRLGSVIAAVGRARNASALAYGGRSRHGSVSFASASSSSRRASHAETSARRDRSASSKALSGASLYGGGSLRRGKVAPAPAETIEPGR